MQMNVYILKPNQERLVLKTVIIMTKGVHKKVCVLILYSESQVYTYHISYSNIIIGILS